MLYERLPSVTAAALFLAACQPVAPSTEPAATPAAADYFGLLAPDSEDPNGPKGFYHRWPTVVVNHHFYQDDELSEYLCAGTARKTVQSAREATRLLLQGRVDDYYAACKDTRRLQARMIGPAYTTESPPASTLNYSGYGRDWLYTGLGQPEWMTVREETNTYLDKTGTHLKQQGYSTGLCQRVECGGKEPLTSGKDTKVGVAFE
jgi:hypothetical protein